MSKRDASLLIKDMKQAIDAIDNYCATLDYQAFVSDRKTVDAVLRNLTILGEVASRIPQDFKTANPEIEWDKIAKSRHVIVHDYFSVDTEIIWKIVTVYLPLVKKAVLRLEKQA